MQTIVSRHRKIVRKRFRFAYIAFALGRAYRSRDHEYTYPVSAEDRTNSTNRQQFEEIFRPALRLQRHAGNRAQWIGLRARFPRTPRREGWPARRAATSRARSEE